MSQNLLNFCDLLCKYAQLPKDTGVDGSKSCRTFIALYCTRKKRLVHKNMPCKEKVPKTKTRKTKGSSRS
jgi:hypothetical protein